MTTIGVLPRAEIATCGYRTSVIEGGTTSTMPTNIVFGLCGLFNYLSI
jgi:hypothetical protein